MAHHNGFDFAPFNIFEDFSILFGGLVFGILGF